MKELLKNNLFILFSFILAAFGIWTLSDVFFWKDDWFFLRAYLNKEEGFVIGQTFVSDVKPLFKYVMNFQFQYFGERYTLYNYFSVFLFSIWCYSLYSVFYKLTNQRSIGLFIGGFMLVNPANFMNLHCIFQQTELIHLIFLSLFLIGLINYTSQPNYWLLVLSAISIILAHFFFPNSLLLPIAGILYIFLLHTDRKSRIIGALLFVSALIPLLLHYWILSEKYTLFEGEQKINFFQAIVFSIHYVGISFLRLLLYTANDYPALISFVAGIFILGSFAILHFKMDNRQRKLNLFFFVFLLFTTGTVSLAREGNLVLYYYSQLHIIPIFWILYQLFHKVWPLIPKQFTNTNWIYTVVGSYLLLALLQINYSKQFFSARNTLNKFITEKNINEESETEIYDEPIAAKEMKKFNDAYITYSGEDGPKALAKLISGLKGSK